MPKVTTITCDKCEKDLQYTSYQSEYYICVSPGAKRHKGKSCFAMAIDPDIRKPHYFCNLKCLRDFFLPTV